MQTRVCDKCNSVVYFDAYGNFSCPKNGCPIVREKRSVYKGLAVGFLIIFLVASCLNGLSNNVAQHSQSTSKNEIKVKPRLW